MSSHTGTKAVVAALSANAFIAVTKFAAWALTGASSMLAEGVHSLADTSNQLLLLQGGRAAKRPADAEHPFGYGRARYINAFLVAIILFSLGGLFAVYEAFEKYEEVTAGHRNELLEGPWWWVPVVVLVASIAAEAMSFRTALRESSGPRSGRGLLRFIRETKSPELPVILLEDFAALIGLVFALLGVGLTLLTRNGLWDAVGTGAIGVLLLTVAVTLAVEIRSLLLGEAAAPEVVRQIEQALRGAEGVTRLIHLRTVHVAPEEILVAAKIGVAPTDSAKHVADAID
ncbi:MAG: cation diffusion facilitator family transporter, partial [Propionibacteriaceae bacterium]|nr:cation diffusion facilitator family transporter [Propionibacteriaceae bacterium]